MLHAILLALPRGLMSMASKLAHAKGLLALFNEQHSLWWSAELDDRSKSKKLVDPTFHGPVAKALIRRYASCIARDEATDTFTLRDRERWPLRGIVDDSDPNLHHILAAFWWVDVEMTLATQLVLNQGELDRLFEASLDVTVRIAALSVFGCGYPKYAHYHLHAPWQLLAGRFGGWRLTAEDVGEAMHQLWKRLSQQYFWIPHSCCPCATNFRITMQCPSGSDLFWHFAAQGPN